MKRLVVCCDGTWNRPDSQTPTNVAKLWRAVAERDENGIEQPVLYHPGVGTGRFDHIRGGGFGWGLSRNVRDCYRFVASKFEPGDELFLFGFSRGAYTARSTVGLIRNAGILRREHIDRVDEAYDLYRGNSAASHPNGAEAARFRERYSHDEIAVRFVGVWDTVGALGIPGVPKLLAGKLWAFHDTQLSSKVELAYQALAIDERRRLFAPSLWYRKADDDNVLQQRWFAGVHSNVGGGYGDCSLADITLLWMAGKAREGGLALKPDNLVVDEDPHDEDRRLGKQVCPKVDGELGDSYKGFYKLLPPYERPFVDRKHPKDGVAASSSATTRGNYSPGNLEKYLKSGGSVD